MPIIDGQEKQPIVAICYDFDKTLSPDDMQAQGFIQSVGYDVAKFWEETGKLARENNMDSNLAYMYKMVQEAKGNLVFSRAALEEYGSRVKLFDGVNGWFERLREYGLRHDVKVEHYIISSGLKEMIEGTRIAREGAFERIYASSFYFDEHGMVKWPAQVVNYTNKTQYLFRISKGVLDINDAGVISATALKCENGYDTTAYNATCGDGNQDETTVAVKLVPIPGADSSDISARGTDETTTERSGAGVGLWMLAVLGFLGFRRK